MSSTGDGHVVVVGASLAGLRAAEGLRKSGYAGQITVFGDERYGPYNRPPLSKGALATDEWSISPELFRISAALDDVEWRLGTRVTSADFERSVVASDDGRTTTWDGLVIASGLRPRRLGVAGNLERRVTLRTVEDAVRIRTFAVAGARVVIVGAGFVGCEIALSLASVGVETHIVDPLSQPLERALGPVAGAAIGRHLDLAGAQVHLGTTLERIEGEGASTKVLLTDGSVLPADLIVESIGSVCNVEWLHGNGLDLTDGVVCDGEMRVEGRDRVVACGDLARFPHRLCDGDVRRVEHWMMAGDTGRRAGRNLGLHLTGGCVTQDFDPMPSFWSDLGDLRLQSFGFPAEGMGDVRLLEGDLDDEAVIGYFRGGALVGVVLFGMSGRQAHYRSLIAGYGRHLS